MTVLLESGTQLHLPSDLLKPSPPAPRPPTQTMTISDPESLENGILDVDGRVNRTERVPARPHNPWKVLTLWRWRGDDAFIPDDRGGRENHGTLYYLRSNFYHDR